MKDQATAPSSIDDTLPDVPDEVSMRQNLYFPTQVFSFQLDEQVAKAANEILLKEIYAERKQDQKGIQKSNFRSLGGWHSRNNLHEKPQYKKLTELISACCASVSKQNGYDRSYRLQATTMWSIINPPGSSNRSHIHPASLWSGVYYVQTPENAGNIEFTDPRTQQLMMPPRYVPNKKRSPTCWTKVNFTPKSGLLLIFPSWLYHSVAPNLSEKKGTDSERVIISFNISQVAVSEW
jgi:uncharacterized protein (TIGR02466 family)